MRLPVKALPTKLPGKFVAGMIGIALVGTAAVLAITWQAGASRAAASEPVLRPARVMTVEYRDTTRSLVLAGTVVPRIEATLGFRVAGKITKRVVDTGSIVQPGQLIAELDPADYRLAVDNARPCFNDVRKIDFGCHRRNLVAVVVERLFHRRFCCEPTCGCK